MTKRILFVWLVCSAVDALAVDVQQQALALWAKAEAVSVFARNTIPAYHETVAFIVQVKGEPESRGEVRYDYLDRKHHRYRTSAPNYEEVRVINADKGWRKDSTNYSFPISQIAGFATPAQFNDAYTKATRIYRTKTGSESLDCVEYKDDQRTYCFTAEGILARREWYGTRVEYSQFREFGGRKLPAHLEMTFGNGTHIEADMEFKLADDLKPEMFTPPDSAGLRLGPGVCEAGTPPKLVSSSDPDYVVGKDEGTAVLWVAIGVDGSVVDVGLLRPLNSEADRAAIAAVKRWKFKPGTCEGKVHDVQINVEINFRNH